MVINYTKSRKEAEETLAECKKLGAGAILVQVGRWGTFSCKANRCSQADIASDDDCKRMAEECYKAFGRIDYLVSQSTSFQVPLLTLFLGEQWRNYGFCGSLRPGRSPKGRFHEVD